MKLKDGFLLREIAGQWIVVPIGERVVEMQGIISLSETGALIWKELEKDVPVDQIIDKIVAEYEIDRETAEKDTKAMIDSIVEKGLAE